MWPLELGLGTRNTRFVAWPLQLGLGTLNPRFVILMGGAKTHRVNGGPVGEDLDLLHPDEATDPVGSANDSDSFVELKVTEIKNGRLAMFSMFGFFAQAIVTREGPAENWASHITDAFAVNSPTRAYVTQFAPSPVAMFAMGGGKNSAWYGADRDQWSSPFSSGANPTYLMGGYPGDYGWTPLVWLMTPRPTSATVRWR